MKIDKRTREYREVVVNGCLIESNKIYVVVPKEPMGNAPEIYSKLGSSKERMPGISNSVTLSQNNSGFEPLSYFLSRDDRFKDNYSEKLKASELYFQVFAKPLELYYPDIERMRTTTDDEFYDKLYSNKFLTVGLYEGVQFDTSNPIDKFRLYIAIVEGELCMKGKRDAEERALGLRSESDAANNDAQYCYVSISDRKDKKEQEANLEMNVSYFFGDLLRRDKETLVSVLQYVTVPAYKNMSDLELNTLYKTAITGKTQILKSLSEAFNKLEEDGETFKQELNIISLLKTKKAREIITKEGSTYYLGEVSLGSNFKSVASFLIKNPDLLEKLNYLLED